MSLFEAFNQMDQANSFNELSWDPVSHEPQYTPTNELPALFQAYQATYTPVSLPGYPYPFMVRNWESPEQALAHIESVALSPPTDKLDPNKIFTADIAALRALAADQNKLLKLFERRLNESLTDKSKFGLNEEDVDAMQAATAARANILAITKEQVNIRKNIADIRLKQQQQSGNPAAPGESTGRGMSRMDVGRGIMDSLFEMSGYQLNPNNVVNYDGAQEASLEQADQLINDLVPTVSDYTKFEGRNPTTVVVVDDMDENDREYVTLDETGQIIDDYPNPKAAIIDVDLTSNRAMDENNIQYDVKKRSELNM